MLVLANISVAESKSSLKTYARILYMRIQSNENSFLPCSKKQ